MSAGQQTRRSPKKKKKKKKKKGRKPTEEADLKNVLVSDLPPNVYEWNGHHVTIRSTGCKQVKPVNSRQANYKTEICWDWQHGMCFRKHCIFAHGLEELRPKLVPQHYRTKPCNKFSQFGWCPYGWRCHFAHILDKPPDDYHGADSTGPGPGSSPRSDSPASLQQPFAVPPTVVPFAPTPYMPMIDGVGTCMTTTPCDWMHPAGMTQQAFNAIISDYPSVRPPTIKAPQTIGIPIDQVEALKAKPYIPTSRTIVTTNTTNTTEAGGAVVKRTLKVETKVTMAEVAGEEMTRENEQECCDLIEEVRTSLSRGEKYPSPKSDGYSRGSSTMTDVSKPSMPNLSLPSTSTTMTWSDCLK